MRARERMRACMHACTRVPVCACVCMHACVGMCQHYLEGACVSASGGTHLSPLTIAIDIHASNLFHQVDELLHTAYPLLCTLPLVFSVSAFSFLAF